MLLHDAMSYLFQISLCRNIYMGTLQITFVFNGYISSSKSSLQKWDIMLAPSASPIILIVVLKRSLKNKTFPFYYSWIIHISLNKFISLKKKKILLLYQKKNYWYTIIYTYTNQSVAIINVTSSTGTPIEFNTIINII